MKRDMPEPRYSHCANIVDGKIYVIGGLKTYMGAPRPICPTMEVAEHFGLRVKYQSHQGDAYGYFAPERREIVLKTHDRKTFWHELGHAAHERVKGQLKGGQDPKEEAVAELSATAIAGLYGSDWSGNCWRYLEGYSQNPLGLCLSVLSEVEKVLSEILGHATRTTEALDQVGAICNM